MGSSPTISPPFLMESGHPNREVEVKDQNLRESSCDISTEHYNNWLVEDERRNLHSDQEESPGLLFRPGRAKSWSPTLFDEDFFPTQPDPYKDHQLPIMTKSE